MKQVSADLSLKEALAQAEGLTEVRDERGILLGFVVSPFFGEQIKEERRTLYDYVESLFSKEAIEQARNNPKVYSTEDVLKLIEGR
jgi:hypothetical protein